jgi:hypothetical protein
MKLHIALPGSHILLILPLSWCLLLSRFLCGLMNDALPNTEVILIGLLRREQKLPLILNLTTPFHLHDSYIKWDTISVSSPQYLVTSSKTNPEQRTGKYVEGSGQNILPVRLSKSTCLLLSLHSNVVSKINECLRLYTHPSVHVD